MIPGTPARSLVGGSDTAVSCADHPEESIVSSRQRPSLFGRMPWPERAEVTRALRTETVGGMVLLAAAVIALAWANSPWREAYESLRDAHVDLPLIGLDLSVEHWASDGLLSVFFLVAGVELKRELTVGELRRPAAAALPVVAAVCGMVVPALVYVGVAAARGGSLNGWAVPMATDIAFALAVLAVIGNHLPTVMRAFLLTLAVVDDLGAIVVIAVFFTASLNWAALGGALAGLVLFFILQWLRVRGWWWYVPLGLAIWALTQASGVHATVAGVALGLLLRATRDEARGTRPAEAESPAERVEHLLRPISAGLAVPLFALFAAGVSVSGDTVARMVTDAESLGVILGLVAGKTLGVFGGTYLVARYTRARLDPDLEWADVFALAVLTGIGFTVSLLIGELAFPGGSEHAKAAVLAGSLTAALLAAGLLRLRDTRYRRLWERENEDTGGDGILDIYQDDDKPVI
jgi:NhaA family Na+:H+ antiporter